MMIVKSCVGVGVISMICLATSVSAGPIDVPGLRLWLDAGQHITKDGSDLVSSWGDITDATNNTVAQNVGEVDANQQPLWVANAIGGQPAVRFDGANDGLKNTVDNLLGSGTDRTIFVVGQASTGDALGDGLGGSLVVIRRDSLDGTKTFFNAQIYDNSGWNGLDEACCGTANPTALYTDGIAINNVVSESVFPISTVTQPFLSVHQVSSLSLTFNVNGADVPIKRLFNNQFPAPVSAENSPVIGFEIGERDDKDTQLWEGDIAEILIYERSLSLSERQVVSSYLGGKYGLSVVPEPGTLVLLGIIGITGLMFGRTKR